jgi:hypothetical protein
MAAAKKPTPKPTPKPTMKATKAPVGAAAVAALQKQVSKAGVAKSEVKQKQAIDKKYPGLYKK